MERSSAFDLRLKGLGKQERKAVFTHFISTFEQGGFEGLNTYTLNGYPVRNKSSDNVDTDHPNFSTLVKYAQKHKLWHFHIGFYDYNYEIKGYEVSPKNDLTSQWVVHYQLHGDSHINAIDITPHPPFDLPPEDKF